MRFSTKDLLQPFHTTWLPGEIQAAMLRLDLVHPLVQGNKWFKLKRNLEAAGPLPVVTFGGPWSNHLHAAAAACKLLGKPVTGIVRGEAPSAPSRTLAEAAALGMEIVHVPRAVYDAVKKGDLSARELDFPITARLQAADGPQHPRKKTLIQVKRIHRSEMRPASPTFPSRPTFTQPMGRSSQRKIPPCAPCWERRSLSRKGVAMRKGRRDVRRSWI
ncbi:hypothetical protein [Chitinophaga caseinilytica]|uniref:Tryptophan synthase beta chain-like PALP domain-containing protein n=1 Tax=Chitinophaga caseinilytica TaxID=2267521 RepID=A0ABZ2Z211_9BACT